MFSCFNPDKTLGHRCEWKGGNLQEFVSQYNRKCGTTYVLAECLDAPKPGVQQLSLKQPEVLLQGGCGEKPMVIERKQVVGEAYALHHGNLHVLYEMVPESLSLHFGDAVYALEINEESLRGRRKKEVQAAASEIADRVIAERQRVKSGATIGSNQPFPWRFSRVPDHSREENDPEAGVGIHVYGSNAFDNDPQSAVRRVEEAYTETRKVLEQRLSEAAPKFVMYQDHLKVVVLEFYGDRSLLDEDDAKKMVAEIKLPALIDEVWVAQHAWVSAWDYEIGYERVR